MRYTLKTAWNHALADWHRHRHPSMPADNPGQPTPGGGSLAMTLNAIVCRDHCAAFCFWLRLSRLPMRTGIGLLAKIMRRRLQNKYGLQIQPQTEIGRGLYIGHGIGIVIHPLTRIGANCNISQNLTIGSNRATPAVIGDNVYIGPGVCIVENVRIGDGAIIGAGAVVVKDIPAGATAVGNPARILSRER